ncbi:MAG: hypothetical protein M3R52_13120 [Acidobacteriota bacterium]|nr:hypothetical protein [Acidobacteriota bacterium]
MNCATIYFQGRFQRSFVSLLICAGAISGAYAAPQAERKQILSRARETYYNLRRSGLIEFQSNITPNWELLLTGVESNPGAMKLLRALHFSMSIDSDSKLRMDHHADITPPDQKSIASVDKIFKGMDEAVSRFVATWSVFTLTSPFPAIESDYEVKTTPDQYQFSHKEGAIDVLTITDKDFMIIEIKVSGGDFKASLKPVLEKTEKGFILRGYAANYETASGARNTQVKVRLEYQEVSGLQLPSKVSVDTVYEGRPAQFEWLFTEYQVKVR